MTGIITNMSSHLHAHATPLSQRLIRYVSFVLAGFVFYSIQAPANEQWGPFDYYDPPKGSVAKVERPHFGALTQDRARRGDWCWYWGDLEYTLGKFPNHPRALEATAEFLEEHLKYGLPKTDEILVFIDKSLRKLGKSAKTSSFPNLNLLVRYLIMRTWITRNKFIYHLYLKGYLLLIPILRLCNFGTCYRRVFVIEFENPNVS